MDFQSQIDSSLYSKFQQFQPVTYLLKDSQKTDIPRVYANKELQIKPGLPWIIFMIGPSGVGKDTVLQPLIDSGLVVSAKTATNRLSRLGESKDAYIWMRPRRNDEGEAEYINNLINEYQLIEYDLHNGNLYGLPLDSLEKVLGAEKLVLIKTENSGTKSIIDSYSNLANMICVFLVPDSYEQLWERIKERDNALDRMKKSLDEIKDAPSVANFFIHNSEIPDETTGKSGLEVSQDSLIELAKKYSGR